MQYLFGVNITRDPLNRVTDGAVFATKHAAPQPSSLSPAAIMQADPEPEPPGVPLILPLLALLCTLAFVVCGILTVMDPTIPRIAAALVSMACAGIFFAAHHIRQRKARKYAHSRDYRASRALRQIRTELEIPEKAVRMDAVAFRYREGKRAFIEQSSVRSTQIWCFIAEGMLCLADTEMRLEIPLAEIKSVSREGTRMTFREWPRQDPPSCIAGVQECPEGWYVMVHSVRIRDVRDDFVLHLPCYEVDAFRKLTQIPMV